MLKENFTVILQKIAPLLLFIGVFYFLIIRPQSKRHEEHQKLIESLKIGDQVATSGGIVGKIIEIKDKVIVLESCQTKIEVLKFSIYNVRESKNEEVSK